MVMRSSIYQILCRQFLGLLTSRLFFSLLCIFSVTVVQAESLSASPEEIELGRRIYLEGVLASGEPLKAIRQNTVQLEGKSAACESCHRRSGMGSLEGNVHVPPISGRFLYASVDDRALALVDTRQAKDITRAHVSYDEKSLAKAIREGVHVSGREMSILMPHYALTDKEIKAISAYLNQLSNSLSLGVSDDSVHFATIITPDVDPKKSAVMVEMLRHAFEQRNSSQQTYSGRMRMPLDLIPRKLRNWDLSVWELKGASDTWGAQLIELNKKDPVFAVISGLSVGTWNPIDQFCQQEKLPCLLPNVVSPPENPSYYSLYFSRGVGLEAEVLARYLKDKGKKAPHRIVQIYRDNEVGLNAAKAFTQAMAGSEIIVENHVLTGVKQDDLKVATKGVSSKDSVMLWLSSSDLAVFNKFMAKQVPQNVFVSGYLTSENYSFNSKALNPHLRVVYPYELGDKRKKNVAAMKEWLKSWRLPLVDEPFQTEVFFDALFLTDLTSQMLDNLYRDYLIERAEDMLSLGSNVSAYPHLSLSRGQRFASKGAYIARIGDDGKLIADSAYIVP